MMRMLDISSWRTLKLSERCQLYEWDTFVHVEARFRMSLAFASREPGSCHGHGTCFLGPTSTDLRDKKYRCASPMRGSYIAEGLG